MAQDLKIGTREITIEECSKLFPVWEIEKKLPILEHKIQWIDKDSWNSDSHVDEWIKKGRPWLLLPAFVVQIIYEDRYLCCFEVGYGHDVVVDMLNGSVFTAKQGIFQPEWCFMSDYYGYPEGAFFFKA